jgi:hypothetical protein
VFITAAGRNFELPHCTYGEEILEEIGIKASK